MTRHGMMTRHDMGSAWIMMFSIDWGAKGALIGPRWAQWGTNRAQMEANGGQVREPKVATWAQMREQVAHRGSRHTTFRRRDTARTPQGHREDTARTPRGHQDTVRMLSPGVWGPW